MGMQMGNMSNMSNMSMCSAPVSYLMSCLFWIQLFLLLQMMSGGMPMGMMGGGMHMSFFFGFQCSLLFSSFNLETPAREATLASLLLGVWPHDPSRSPALVPSPSLQR